MPGSQSTDVFVRLVQQRFQEFRQRLSQLMQSLPRENQKDKVEKAQDLLRAAEALADALADQDRPSWIEPIRDALRNYSGNPAPSHASALMTVVAKHYPAIDTHSWEFDFSTVEPFDFDGLFAKYRDASRIPELFDELIRILEEVVQCDDLDSRRIVRGVETIIATLKRNRKGSFFSMVCTWDFVRTYLKNFAWELFEKIPLANIPIKALHSTIAEMDKEVSKLYQDMQSEVRTKLAAEFPVLTYQARALPDLSSSETTHGNE